MKLAPVLLAAILATSMTNNEPISEEVPLQNKPFIVEDNYSPSDAFRIIKSENLYEKLTIYGKEQYKQTVQSTNEILHLPICLTINETDEDFLLPSEIEGIVMDIPFNYYSSLEASAKYFQTLLANGWEIDYYNATSLSVQTGLVKDGVNCRLIIYENYLKVYCKLIC